MKIKFLKDIELNVIENIELADDYIENPKRKFNKNEIIDVFWFGQHENNIEFELESGAIIVVEGGTFQIIEE